MFLACAKLYWFFYEGKAYQIKFHFRVYLFQDPPVGVM
jgi:hypothetical protein